MNPKRLALILACCAAAGSCMSCSDEPDPKESCYKESALVCKPDGVYICRNGYLELSKTCSGTTPYCDPKLFICVANNICQGNEAKCDNNALMICDNGAWSVIDQCLNMICDVETRTCKMPTTQCIPGCVNNILTTCTNNIQSRSECPYGCNAAGTDCEPAPTTPEPVCTNGETKCAEDTLFTCINGNWNAGEPCLQGETCGLDDFGIFACISAPMDITSCKFYLDNSSIYHLEDGQSRCIGTKAVSCHIPDNAVEEPEVEVQDCSATADSLCIVSEGQASCVEDLETPCSFNSEQLAHGDSACGDDHNIVTCSDGELQVTPCEADSPCAPVNGKFECHKVSASDCEVPNGGIITTGTGVCADNVYKVCQDGALNDEATCTGQTPICDASADGYCRAYKDCSDTLAHGAVSCNEDNTAIVSCIDGLQDTVQTCEAPAKCELQNDTPACINNAPKYTTIKDLKTAYDTVVAAGTQGLTCDIAVTGVVTAGRGKGANIFFQDGSSIASDQAAGIYIYNSAKDLGSFEIGDNIKVTASTLLVYNGQLEIVNATVEKTNATDTVIPKEINDISTILETTAEAKNPNNLMLVTLKNVTTEDGKTIKDSASHSINVSTYIAKDLVKADTTFKYDITGIVNYNKTTSNTIEAANGLAPRSSDDIVAVGCINTDHIFTAATGSEAAKCESAQTGDEYCDAGETSYACKTINAHSWRVVCEDGTSKPGEMGTVDCTAQGMLCTETINDAYCAICTEDNVSLCTESIPANAKHICEMGFVPSCGWECEPGFVLNSNEDGCVGSCITNACDGDKLKVCNTQTGQYSAPQTCTGDDAHGIYACSNGACGLSSCATGYHKEGNACVVNCTTDVCDGNKIKICNKQTGVLADATACSGSDAHGVYTCSANACGLSSCTSGYHKEGNACVANCTTDVCDGAKIKICNKQTGVLANATACTGNDAHGTYACANNVCALSGCTSGYHKEGSACVANCTADVCDGNKIKICNKQTGVLADATTCSGSDAHGVYACSAGACGLSSCTSGYHKEGNACVANCTTNVCDGAKIKICDKSTGILASAIECTGSDAHGNYACSNNVCTLSSCVSGYHKEGSVCVANCTTDVCDGDKIKVCNKTTGVLSAAQACTGSDAHGVYACTSNACTLSGCATGYHKEGNTCVANCTTDVCDGVQIKVCNKTTGVLSAPQACTGPDAHGVYTCSNKACGLSSCISGYHKEGSACVKDPEATCTGTNWLSGATYTVAHEGYGCNSEHELFLCQDGDHTSLTDTCGTSKPYCNPAGSTTQTICAECLTDSHCAVFTDPGTHEIGYCTEALECNIKCETTYALGNSSNCERLGATFNSINNDHAYATVNQLTYPSDTIKDPRFACSMDRTKAISTWVKFAASPNPDFDNGGGANVEYMADLGSLNGTYYCTFLFDVDGTTYIAEKESGSWAPIAASDDYVFPNSAPLWTYTGTGGGLSEWVTIVEAPEKYIAGEKVATADADECKDQGDKTTKASCNNASSNIGETSPSNGVCVKPTNTSWTCSLNSATNPSAVELNNATVNKNGYLSVSANKWGTSEDFSTKYLKLSLSDAQMAALAGKTKIRASFKCLKNGATSPDNLAVAFFSKDTKLGSAHTNEITTTESTCVSEEVSLSSTSELNLRITGWSSTASSAAVRIFPITIEAR